MIGAVLLWNGAFPDELYLNSQIYSSPRTSKSVIKKSICSTHLLSSNNQSRKLYHSMMLSQLFLASALAMAAVAAPTPLPPCSAVHRPCQCPAGTTYSNSTTYAVIGASAIDVKAVTGSCQSSIPSRYIFCFTELERFRYGLVRSHPIQHYRSRQRSGRHSKLCRRNCCRYLYIC
jgi:hypothetical protein